MFIDFLNCRLSVQHKGNNVKYNSIQMQMSFRKLSHGTVNIFMQNEFHVNFSRIQKYKSGGRKKIIARHEVWISKKLS